MFHVEHIRHYKYIMENTTSERKGAGWMIKLIIPLLILLFSAAFLYVGYFSNGEITMPVWNQIIWWVLFLYGLIRTITVIIKKK